MPRFSVEQFPNGKFGVVDNERIVPESGKPSIMDAGMSRAQAETACSNRSYRAAWGYGA